jgi:hypothetical protein
MGKWEVGSGKWGSGEKGAGRINKNNLGVSESRSLLIAKKLIAKRPRLLTIGFLTLPSNP